MSKKILIINVNWLGDVLFTTPFIRSIREHYPDSHITCLVHPRCKEILDDNPLIDEIMIYDEEGLHRSAIGKARLVLTLRKKRIDAAFILHRSFTKALLAYLAGAKDRIGYATKNRAALLTKPIKEPRREIHKADYFLNIAKAVGLTAKDSSYEFFIKDSDRAEALALLKKHGVNEGDSFFVLCPGGNWEPKRWPMKNFARLADQLIKRYSAKIVITGAKNDIDVAREVGQRMEKKPVILAGLTTLKTLGAIIERAKAVIANDTGAMHIASAMGSPTIALYGPTSPDITGPRGKGKTRVVVRQDDCDIPCYDYSCRDNWCMKVIKINDVLEAVDALATPLVIPECFNPRFRGDESRFPLEPAP